MADLVVVLEPTANLVPYAGNARLHSDAQVAQIAASINEFGFNVPVLVDAKGSIVAGHGRVLAAQRLGMEQVPVIRLGHLTAAQVRAYRIADNQIALNSTWDESVLAAELRALAGDDFNLSLLGFDDSSIQALLALPPAGGTGDPDADAPEAPANPVSRLGDTWLLGAHRLRCGDSTNAEDVAALLAGATPHLMVTDPPYGVKYDAAWRQRAGVGGAGSATGRVLNDDKSDWREAWALFPGEVAYVWHADRHARSVVESLEAEGFDLRAQIIWAKSTAAIGRGHYHFQHEPCWYAVRKGGTGHWAGDRKQTTLWEIDRPRKSETGHSTQKPVECMQRPIENNSKPGDQVYEPFSGSGTTIIAGQVTGRRVLAMELSPAYVDVAVQRWEAYTGQRAILEGDGREHAAIAEDRAGDGDASNAA